MKGKYWSVPYVQESIQGSRNSLVKSYAFHLNSELIFQRDTFIPITPKIRQSATEILDEARAKKGLTPDTGHLDLA